jgi:acetyl esterase/lipase
VDANSVNITRHTYGEDPEQFGELRLPSGSGPFPVVVYVHGGGWSSAITLAGAVGICSALTEQGYATWSIEYRRVGNGGGWPETFDDLVAAAALLPSLAKDAPLDLSQVFVAGQSAGGQLALWLAHHASTSGVGSLPAFRGLVALAPATDLRAIGSGSPDHALVKLLGGQPADRSDVYAAASPLELLPIGLPQLVVHGTSDRTVPHAMSETYVGAARAAGDRVELVSIDGADHLDLWNPASAAFPQVLAAATSFLESVTAGAATRA